MSPYKPVKCLCNNMPVKNPVLLPRPYLTQTITLYGIFDTSWLKLFGTFSGRALYADCMGKRWQMLGSINKSGNVLHICIKYWLKQKI